MLRFRCEWSGFTSQAFLVYSFFCSCFIIFAKRLIFNPLEPSLSPFLRVWHISGNRSQILALASNSKSLEPFKSFPPMQVNMTNGKKETPPNHWVGLEDFVPPEFRGIRDPVCST